MKIVVLSFKIGPAARPPVRPPSARPPSACPPVRPSARAGAGRTYIYKTPDRPPWAAVTRIKSTARVSLAEVFHPWVRWEGPGSGFENSSGAGAGGGVWKSRIHRFGPLGIEVEKQGFRSAWLITGQKLP